MPCRQDLAKTRQRLDALLESLSGENREFHFGNVQPATVLGGEVKLKLLGESASFGRLEGFVESGERVGTEVIHHRDDAFGGGIDLIGELTKEMGEVDGGASFGCLRDDFPLQRLDREKDIGGAAAPIFVIDASGSSWSRGEWSPNVLEQLLARLVDAHLWKTSAVGPMIDLKHILHGVHERRIFGRRDAEALFSPRFELIFF